MIPAVFARGEIVLRVPAAVVDAATYPAVLDPTISPEFNTDDPVYPSAAMGAPSSPVVTLGWTGNTGVYLVAWRERRAEAVESRSRSASRRACHRLPGRRLVAPTSLTTGRA